MNSVEDICEKCAIQNALEHGEAKIGPVMGMIMSAHPELREEAKAVKETAIQVINRINALQNDEIRQIAQQKYPELLTEEEDETTKEDVDFIRKIINEDMRTGKYNGRVHTRFPPEPNGYLHIGHAKSINLNYGIAQEYNGKFNLRFDDTNPATEEEEYVKSIIEDVKWLGADWEDRLFFASNYFEKFYEYAVQLIKKGKAYVDDLSVEKIREYRGTLTEPGKESPYRNRSIEENLDLFERMKNGEFPDGSKVLRAKIDMAHPNLLMRDPIIYRIMHKEHHNTGDKWCIYPLYDWAHCLEDSIERITHSICTLEFEVHRELYDWYLDQLEDENGEPIYHPQQIEFARLNISYTVLSKRRLLRLVNEGYVDGWDDPRMPTIAGMRRRGITPEAIRSFTDDIGVSKRDTIIEHSTLDYHVRVDLDRRCPRVMSVLRPLKVVITNYPENKEEEIEVANHSYNKEMGTRKIKFSKIIYIEKDDFMENPPEDYYRLSTGKEVRLKYAYVIKCEKVIKDEETGEIKELHCTYDPETKEKTAKDGLKVKGNIHWISANNAIKAEVRLYDRLFIKENPMEVEEGKDFTDYINPNSLEIVQAYVEPFLKEAEPGSRYQFERLGYFCIDIVDSTKDSLVFNRIITLRDTWGKNKQK
ncbi:MAG: glutamine--tRNA ligase/YqeY domain fusion protein [Candidatus Heimdallarchaeaceae archaeon]